MYLFSLAPQGLEAQLVKVEVEHFKSLPGMVIVGLADTAVQESRERVRAAIKNSGFQFPKGRVVINLAPADLRKSGPLFDLPMALALISLSATFKFPDLDRCIFLGELSLDGSLRHVNGVLSLVHQAKARGFVRVFVPSVNAEEAALVPDMIVYGISDLKQVVQLLTTETDDESLQVRNIQECFQALSVPQLDFSAIRGQKLAKRAMEIAAAGGHNILLSGSPGSGKTMLGRALAGILPPLDFNESMEVTQLYSLAGQLPKDHVMLRSRPFRVLHPSASMASLTGGGRFPRPGEISLAHRGVLFLDEMAEFSNSFLELLRQPLEDRVISLNRVQASVTYPAQVLLCGAMNPCPCGYYQVPHAKKTCECLPAAVTRYQQKISGPLLDRIDLICTVSPVSYQDLAGDQPEESSLALRARVLDARQRQRERYRGGRLLTNAEMSSLEVKKYCHLRPAVARLLEQSMEKLSLTARGYHRVLKVALTIADLSGDDLLGESHVLEALQYRKVPESSV